MIECGRRIATNSALARPVAERSLSGAGVSMWIDDVASSVYDEAVAGTSVPATADVVIVGGGFTGLWTAIRLLESDPSADICVIEAKHCGYGASGRNGGIAEGSWAKFPAMRRLYGAEEGIRLATLFEHGVDELISFCDQHGIDPDIRRRGSLWAATNESQIDSWATTRAILQSYGVDPFSDVASESARQMVGSPRVVGGVYEPGAATLHPAKLVLGLRRVAIELGAAVIEEAAVTGFGGRNQLEVRTTKGFIRTSKVVLATNAWLATRPEIKPHVFVTSSEVMATAAVPELLVGDLKAGLAVSDSRRLINYWRSTPDGRLVLGKGGGTMSRGNRVDARFTGPSPYRDTIVANMHDLYPSLEQVKVNSTWSGAVDYSSSGLPYFGLLNTDPRILVGVGYSGVGIVQSMIGGRILASLALDLDDEYANLPLTNRWPDKFPPDPFRSLGAPIVKKAMVRKESSLDSGSKPGRITQMISGLDPTTAPSQA